MADEIGRAVQHANGAPVGGPKAIMQVVITLLDTGACNLTHTCPNEIMTRGLLDKARSILDLQTLNAIREAESRIVTPPDGLRI
jgi:hypothetical protein